MALRPPDAGAVRAALGYIERRDPEFACWLHIAVATGARRGEISALRWSDVDVERATLRMERSVAVTRAAGVAFKSAKSGNVRLVSLTCQAIVALAAQRQRAIERRHGAPIAGDEQIFTRDPTG